MADTPPAPPNSEPKGADVDKSADKSVAKGKGKDALGEQVSPDTQLREDDGNRTLARPVVDPGPYMRDGGPGIKNPDRSKGEHRYSDCNEPVPVTMRTSTGHSKGYGKGGEITSDVEMAPDVFISGAASDTYNKESGKSLTDMAAQHAADPKEVARTSE